MFLFSIFNNAKFTVNQKGYLTALYYGHITIGHQNGTSCTKMGKCCSKLIKTDKSVSYLENSWIRL